MKMLVLEKSETILLLCPFSAGARATAAWKRCPCLGPEAEPGHCCGAAAVLES